MVRKKIILEKPLAAQRCRRRPRPLVRVGAGLEPLSVSLDCAVVVGLALLCVGLQGSLKGQGHARPGALRRRAHEVLLPEHARPQLLHGLLEDRERQPFPVGPLRALLLDNVGEHGVGGDAVDGPAEAAEDPHLRALDVLRVEGQVGTHERLQAPEARDVHLRHLGRDADAGDADEREEHPEVVLDGVHGQEAVQEVDRREEGRVAEPQLAAEVLHAGHHPAAVLKHPLALSVHLLPARHKVLLLGLHRQEHFPVVRGALPLEEARVVPKVPLVLLV
mmetsp:Transcript_2480/g.5902  ORF Transcript_2480/g.5902 Transcript_2480/m.5902 type:complete len:277 (-) Transcript_2480:654-1484(-)